MGVLLFLLEYIHTTIAGLGERHKGMGEYKCVASILLSCSSCKDDAPMEKNVPAVPLVCFSLQALTDLYM